MTTPKIAPYGSWRSPITADALLAGSIGLGGVCVSDGNVYWLEGRPAEKGRNVLVEKNAQGEQRDLTPAPFNVRSRVHEYGGGAFLVADKTVYFTNFADQRLYAQPLDGDPRPLTPAGPDRFADFVLDQPRQRLMTVCESHREDGPEPENYLAVVDLQTGMVTPLTQGHDFYSSPRLSPDGQQLAWITWDHPNLPWDATQLWLADLDAQGNLHNIHCIAGDSGNESIHEPRWSPDGSLYFVGDRSDWWNLYRYRQGQIEAVYPDTAEFAYPHWVFGLSSYTFANANTLICTFSQDGAWQLGQIDLAQKQLSLFNLPYSNYASLCTDGQTLWFLGSSPQSSSAVVAIALGSNQTHVLKQSSELVVPGGYLSLAQPISFPTENGHMAHAWYYPPTNADFEAPPGTLPPLLVKSHGGPTAAAGNALSLKIQYWTSRGFAYVDVNYGGSTGYGRAYRQRLQGQWGVVDVADCVNAAAYLAQQGLVDSEKLAISGSSAGGYTTLAALTFHDTFKAGASYYGISDLTALAEDTHKFESRYLDGLIGPYPERKDLYERRSPIHYSEQLTCPVIFFQGLEDKVVPPNQAEMMVNALKAKGITVEYVPFPEEQHGFRIAANIKKALEAELAFYGRVFGFVPTP
ncbi:MAG: S9 family peptidase [Synechocystis sp.]|nr:S9 family peptidase [Synechocystis sp.]